MAGDNRTGAAPSYGDSHGGLELGPAGRWWDDSHFVKMLKIDSNQQHRMDAVFNANKGTLVALYKSVQREEKQLSKVSRIRNPDEATIFQQIDRVTQARGELEKAEAHYLLDIRKEMTPAQVAKLEDLLPPE
jgi:Spy/CpxP family protein refolding chaperone